MSSTRTVGAELRSTSRRYRNRPVVEALCELFFLESEWDQTIPYAFYERVHDRFPTKTQLEQMGVEVQLGPKEAGAKLLAGSPRIQFSREDGSRMVQVAQNLLVVNQLRPYPKFEEWKPTVSEMLSLYRELAKPKGVDRLGVRYINKIVIPAPAFRMEDYFRIYPEIPPELGSAHGRFLMRLEIPPKHDGHQLIVTFGTAPAEGPESSSELLDLYDVVPAGKADFDNIDRRIEEAHANIEHAFESMITDQARALFAEVSS